MEHLICIFTPGTPENTAIVSMWPALAPMLDQLAQMAHCLRTWARRPKPRSKDAPVVR